jgi:uroporphyrinogen-III synthase
METLILREDGLPMLAPSVRERGSDEARIGAGFVEQLEAGAFELVILMTGVGLAFLRDLATQQMPVERFRAALGRATIVARGPKPVGVLHQLGMQAQVKIGEPNTWREVVAAVAERLERRIAVQEYGRPNPEMYAALEALGATVTPVALYKWELPSDLEPLKAAVRALAGGECEVALFTSSIQIEHLLEVSTGLGLRDAVVTALRTKVVVASIGPVMSEALKANGIPVDIEPKHSKMWSLVKEAGERARAALDVKRG